MGNLVEIETKRWDELLLRRGMKTAIRISQGWLPFEVKNNDLVELDYYWYDLGSGVKPGLIPGGTLQLIGAPGVPYPLIPGVVNYFVPRHASGNAYLYIEEKRNMIAQVFVGIGDPDFKLFYRYPQGTSRKPLQNAIGMNGLAPAQINTKEFGWLVDGEQSPVEAPTGVGEFFVLPQLFIEFGGINNSQRTYPLLTKFMINYLEVKPLNWETPKEKDLIRGMLSTPPTVRCHYWSPGLEPFNYGDADKNFGIKPVDPKEVE